MFSRYRKTPPSSANGVHGRRRSNKNSNQDPVAALTELRNALNRLDELTESFKEVGNALLRDLEAGISIEKKEKAASTKIDSSTPVVAAAVEGDIADENDLNAKDEAQKPPSFRRSPSATASDLLLATNAHFLSIPEKDEEEVVELIRRVAELVVLSERMAGQILEGSSNRRGSSSNNLEDVDDEDEKSNRSEDATQYLALFELFCERNALANIVNIVTGVAFAPGGKEQSRSNSSNSLDKLQSKSNPDAAQAPHILPPLTIATQAVQSVSILIQNVSRATSLYFLLSNNRVNDLIGLPIHLYKRAEMNHSHYLRFARRGSRRPTTYAGLPLPVPPTSQSLNVYNSNEIGELTTHFVSFLKSLAMRVNPETLQFFLTYTIVPDSGHGDGISDAKTALINDAEDIQTYIQPVHPIDTQHSTDDEMDTMSEHLISKIMESESEALNQSSAELSSASAGDNVRSSETTSTTAHTPSSPSIAANLEVAESAPHQSESQPLVDFPLFARALEFCSSDQDSFVRVTAMNICMNMIRLATVQHDDFDVDDMSNDEHNSPDKPDRTASIPTITPSGMLHEAPSLPMRDRIAIAKYACDPHRVNDLVSPLCARLTSQFGQVEGTVRNLQELANASIPKHLQQSRIDKKIRLTNAVHDLVASVQDELMMLDDLLRVGLVSLNEQCIEMLLATFVYPMLLQPLLLPLHRFSAALSEQSDGNSVSSSNQNSAADSRPAIKLQSPPPLCVKATTDVLISDDAPPLSSAPFPPNQNELSKVYSSEDMDLAPSKTALFGITVMFHSVSNPCMKHLLLAALLHLFSPPASGGSVVQTAPQITFSGDHSDIIRMEKNHLLESQSDLRVPVYNFGTCLRHITCCDGVAGSTNLCTFILAPALIDLLSKRCETSLNGDEPSKRCNPYRKIFLSYLIGSGEMVSLQKLAIMALNDIVSKVDAAIILEVASASNLSEQSDSMNDNASIEANLREVLDCLCQSIVNKSVTLDGWWKVSFNPAAAKTLLDVISIDSRCLSHAYNMLTKIRLEAANFLLYLPSRLDEKSRESSSKGNGQSNSVDKQHLETWLLDRFYFDQPNKSSGSVVESICNLADGQCGMEVFGSQSISEASELLCEDSRIVDNLLISETKGNTPFHCAATWALACLSLDAFCVKLFALKSAFDAQASDEEGATRQFTRSDDTSLTNADKLSHLSPNLAMALLDKSDSDDSPRKRSAPEHGSIVVLVGKAAFPCVCEVTSKFASLFTGRTCVSNEGVQWQSLYLVVIGKFAVLAEPERGGSGGEGRVITACKLSCLAVKKDTTIMANNSTPARRLLLLHSSLDQHLPPLFVLEPSSSEKKPAYGPDRFNLSRSRVDLWFEDANACAVAWKALAGKIAKARAKRGSRIRSALLEPDSCLPPLQTERKASF